MSPKAYIKQALFTVLISIFGLSCSTKAAKNIDKEHSFSIKQLYATGELPPTNEADRFVITGTIDETDIEGGSFVVNTIDSDKVALTFRPKQMQESERKSFNAYLLKGNKVKCVATKLDPGVYALLAAKISQQ